MRGKRTAMLDAAYLSRRSGTRDQSLRHGFAVPPPFAQGRHSQLQVKLASGGCGVQCGTQCKLFDRSASCWEIQKGGSPFGRFKGFPKGEYEIPVANRKPSIVVCGWKGRTGKRIWRRRVLAAAEWSAPVLTPGATRFLSARAERNGVDFFRSATRNAEHLIRPPCGRPPSPRGEGFKGVYQPHGKTAPASWPGRSFRMVGA